MQAVVTAINASNLELSARSDGTVVTVSLPKVTAEYRKNLLSIVKKAREEAKGTVRTQRRPFTQHIQNQKGLRGVPKDILKEWTDTLDTLTAKYVKEIDRMADAKEKEIGGD